MAYERGYVETLLRRRRYLPELRSAHAALRAAAERMAINHPVQGTQADMIKLAMIAIDQELERQTLRAHMILQVHDELVFEVPRDELSRLAPLVCARMEEALRLDVPVVVEMKVGTNWYEMAPHRT
jgi:DNA polymerase-1